MQQSRTPNVARSPSDEFLFSNALGGEAFVTLIGNRLVLGSFGYGSSLTDIRTEVRPTSAAVSPNGSFAFLVGTMEEGLGAAVVSLAASSGSEVEDREALASRLRAARTAIASNELPGLEILLDEGLVTTGHEPPLLHLAAAAKNGDMVRRLVEAGIDIDAKNVRTGWTALMVAAKSGNADAVETLLSLGAASDAIGFDGETFLSLLLMSDIPADPSTGAGALKAAVARQLDLRRRDELLGLASFAGDPFLVATLLALGANPNARGPDGWTPLMRAVASTGPDVAATTAQLLLNGADPDLVAHDGSTALAIAIAKQVDERLLRQLIGVTDLRTGAGWKKYQDIASKVGNKAAVQVLPAPSWLPPLIGFPDIPQLDLGLAPEMSQSDIALLQEQLRSLGLYGAAIDGIWGNGTRRGLASYYDVTKKMLSENLGKTCKQGADNLNFSRHRPGAATGTWTFNTNIYNTYPTDASRRAAAGTFTVSKHGSDSRIECLFTSSNGQFVPSEAFLTTVSGVAYVRFNARCSNQTEDNTADFGFDRAISGSKVRVVANYPCRKILAGAPYKDRRLQIWRQY